MSLGLPRVHLLSTGSTNDHARALALAGAPHGTMVTASEQTAGRGRHGRQWWAPAGACLLMSLVLRESQKLLPLAAAVAVCEIAGEEALVKWPNDVVVPVVPARHRSGSGGTGTGGHRGLGKLAGILIEGRPQEGWMVLGIGLNVALDPAQLPAQVRDPAASLRRPREAIEPTLQDLLRSLSRWVTADRQEVLAAWRRRDALLGAAVSWGGGSGIAQGVSDGGCLLVRLPNGSTVELDSGEVRLRAHRWN